MITTRKDSHGLSRFLHSIVKFLQKEHMGILSVIILLVIVLSVIHPRFATTRNILNILLQMSVVSFMSLGLTFVIISGGIDLSVAGVLTLSGVLGSAVMVGTNSALLGVVIIALIGVSIGSINGFMIAKLKMVPFIVTLSIWVITVGIAAWYTEGITIPVPE